MEHDGGYTVPMVDPYTSDFVPDGTSMEARVVELTDRYTAIKVRTTGSALHGDREGWLVLWARTPVSPDDAILGVCCAIPAVSETREPETDRQNALRELREAPRRIPENWANPLLAIDWARLRPALGTIPADAQAICSALS